MVTTSGGKMVDAVLTISSDSRYSNWYSQFYWQHFRLQLPGLGSQVPAAPIHCDPRSLRWSLTLTADDGQDLGSFGILKKREEGEVLTGFLGGDTRGRLRCIVAQVGTWSKICRKCKN
jgi:hypothetical protein